MDISRADFTPSELVYLNGEQFAPKAGIINSTHLIHADLKVSAMPLAQAVIAAAFLTHVKQGTLRLEMRQKKVLFGLASSPSLYAEPTAQPANWPAGTLEAALPEWASRLASAKGSNEVRKIVYSWLMKDVSVPTELVFALIKQGLANRGLLEVRQETHLKVFKTVANVYPESTRQKVAAQPLQPLQQLLASHQQTCPEVHAALLEQIKKAIADRTERDDTGVD